MEEGKAERGRGAYGGLKGENEAEEADVTTTRAEATQPQRSIYSTLAGDGREAIPDRSSWVSFLLLGAARRKERNNKPPFDVAQSNC